MKNIIETKFTKIINDIQYTKIIIDEYNADKLLKSTNIYEPAIKIGLENSDWIKVN
jgi:hypothetical protein